MDTPFPIEFGAETTKLVMPHTALPENFDSFVKTISLEELKNRIRSLGRTAIYYPDLKLGVFLKMEPRTDGKEGELALFGEQLTPQSYGIIRNSLLKDTNAQANLVAHVYVSVIIAASKTVPMHRITPTRRARQTLAPREHNTYWIIDLREHPSAIKTSADYMEYLAAHTGKRLHSVRAHFRHYQNGLVSFICQHVRGRSSNGKADKHINILEKTA